MNLNMHYIFGTYRHDIVHWCTYGTRGTPDTYSTHGTYGTHDI